MEFDGVQLEFQPQALEAVAQEALDRKVGARGLRSVMENLMTEIMYEIPSDLSIQKVTVTEGAVERHEPLEITRDPEHFREPVHKVGVPEKIS